MFYYVETSWMQKSSQNLARDLELWYQEPFPSMQIIANTAELIQRAEVEKQVFQMFK